MPATTLKLRVNPQTDALHRVVSVCHRRSLEIIALHFTGDEIALTVIGEQLGARGIAHWLGALIDVVAVGERDFDRPPAQPDPAGSVG
jgi:hypothetical protein